MIEVNISRDLSGRIVVASPYDPLRVQKIKTIDGHKWHPTEKHWSFPNTDGTLEKILKAFEGEEIQIDPSLQTQLPHPVIARSPENIGTTKQSQENPSLAKRGEGRFSDKKLSATPFDNLKRELLSRKYSYRTVKGYLYYNRDFLTFIGKEKKERGGPHCLDSLGADLRWKPPSIMPPPITVLTSHIRR